MNLHARGDNVIRFPYASRSPVPKQPAAAHVERHDPAALLLDEAGMIQDCSKSVEGLFGYRLSELSGRHISCLFPQLAEAELFQKGQINPRLSFISRCGHVFMGVDKHGDAIPNELSFIRLEHKGFFTLRLILRPACNVQA